MIKSLKSRSENSFNYLKPYISSRDHILDIGSGSGGVARLIESRIGSKVQCLDVQELKKSIIRPVIFDGVNIPFGDDTFTVSICAFILHHARQQETLLREITRVTKSRIIVLEDLADNPVDHVLTHLHRIASHINYRSRNMIFRSGPEWKELFYQQGLTLEKEVSILRDREPLYPISRKMFILAASS